MYVEVNELISIDGKNESTIYISVVGNTISGDWLSKNNLFHLYDNTTDQNTNKLAKFIIQKNMEVLILLIW